MRTLLFAALALPAPALAGGRALVVGADDGGTALAPLRYATRDAERVGQVLEELGGFHVTRLSDPTPEALIQALAVEAALPLDGPFVVYLSGHADVGGLRLGEAHLPWARLQEAVRAVPAPVRIGILDTCHSGVVTRGATMGAPLLAAPSVTGEAWLAASEATAVATETDRLGGGTFTHHLLAALRGAAAGSDGVVSLGEAWAYSASRTAAETALGPAGTQRPVRAVRLRGHGEVPLTRLDAATARVVVPPGSAGPVAILQEGRLLAEVWTDGASPVTVAVPPGPVAVRRRVDGQLREARVRAEDGRTVPIVGGAPVDPGPVALRGVADPLLAEARAVEEVEAALADLEARTARQQAQLDVLDALTRPAVLRVGIAEELGAGWRIEEAHLMVGEEVVWSRTGGDIDLSAVHVDSLPAGSHRVTLTVRLRPRGPEQAVPTLSLTHRERVELEAGARAGLDLSVLTRAPWKPWSERVSVRASHTTAR
jgi:hypothetical protein